MKPSSHLNPAPYPTKTILGCMSGTSLDGIDLAILTTNGDDVITTGKTFYAPYSDDERNIIRAAFMKFEHDEAVDAAERVVTNAHIRAIKNFIAADGAAFDMIGFHGQTITHDPDAKFNPRKFTWQIGDAETLAREFSVPVVYDFRSDDVAAGGEGAPLLPVYHRALIAASGAALPAAVINIGGVSNITYLAADDIIAFDCGAGNALIDHIIQAFFNAPHDKGGAIARGGTVNHDALSHLMGHEFFARPAPKSLDRNPWDLRIVNALPPVDALRTLLQFTVEGIVQGLKILPTAPHKIFITGGGRHNDFLMELLNAACDAPVIKIDTLGHDGDFVEAQGFAYMAARRLYNLPISFKGTTGAPRPMTGGKIITP